MITSLSRSFLSDAFSGLRHPIGDTDTARATLDDRTRFDDARAARDEAPHLAVQAHAYESRRRRALPAEREPRSLGTQLVPYKGATNGILDFLIPFLSPDRRTPSPPPQARFAARADGPSTSHPSVPNPRERLPASDVRRPGEGIDRPRVADNFAGLPSGPRRDRDRVADAPGRAAPVQEEGPRWGGVVNEAFYSQQLGLPVAPRYLSGSTIFHPSIAEGCLYEGLRPHDPTASAGRAAWDLGPTATVG